MNIAIVDDEEIERDFLVSAIKEYASGKGMNIPLYTFSSAEELLESYHPYAYSAIFMDVFMNGIDGVSAAEEIFKSDRDAIIIFLTSSEDHIQKAFSLHAYDYINKPAEKERIFKVIDDLLLSLTGNDALQSLSFRAERNDVTLSYSDIVCVQTSKRNYLEISDKTGLSHHTRLTFSNVSEILTSDPRFLLINQGVIVNMDHIERIVNDFCELDDGSRLPINVRRSREIENTWNNYRISLVRKDQKRKRGRK